jgi:pyridoxal phosphate enzyme (YggS family)
LSTLASRYGEVQDRISAACAEANRSREGVSLIVVTKFHPVQLVSELYDLGHRDFGENKDQEAGPKAQALADDLAGRGISDESTWHFIGQLQSNKVKTVLRYADAIHSLDRESLLQSLAKETVKRAAAAAESGAPNPKPIDVFIELNLTDDEGRGGIQPSALKRFAEGVLEVPGLNLVGVMGVASLEGEEERDFAAIQAASENLRTLKSDAALISAGMSGDFEIALKYGATHLRIGTAITGPRQY